LTEGQRKAEVGLTFAGSVIHRVLKSLQQARTGA